MACRLLANLAKQMQVLIVMWQVYELTHRPLMLGYIGLAEAVPYVAFGLWAGHLVDRHDKKRLILGSLFGLGFCAASLAFLSRAPDVSILLIYGTLALAAVFASLELPSISSYLQMIVPAAVFPRAAAWSLTTYMFATILGPILAGFLISRTSVVTAYGAVAGLYAGALFFASRIRSIASPRTDEGEPLVSSIRAGLTFVLSQRIIFACMALDSFAVLFGDVIFILPVFAAMLGAGPVGLGVLRAAPAIGSCIVSVMRAVRPFIRVSWGTLLRVVFLFGLCIIVFALSKSFALSLAMLALSGAADGVSVIVRQSIYQANTPDALRGRVASVSGIFIRISNELGGFESGLAAQLLGAVPSAVLGGVVTLATVLFMKLKFPRLDVLSFPGHEK